ncbi:hypothetical protein PIB30_068318 [Stylosanthes scabra]|uniref:Uncharacterized protein n=1 Tax=Stylosanthes scabra TaxID=79078 RepID=A0ABU6SPF6_9FABA|nr:hypothetical protein [Stylosanthes scabra]
MAFVVGFTRCGPINEIRRRTVNIRDEEMGLNGGGLCMMIGDMAVVMMCDWALKHGSEVHVYFEHPIDKAVEAVALDDDYNHVPPQPTPTEDTPNKRRNKVRAKRTPTPKKMAVGRNSKKVGQASQNLFHKLSELTTETQPITKEQPDPVAEELDIPQSQPPKESQSQPNTEPQSKGKDGAPRIFVPVEDPDSFDSDPGYHGYESEELGDPESDQEENEKDEVDWPQGNPMLHGVQFT